MEWKDNSYDRPNVRILRWQLEQVIDQKLCVVACDAKEIRLLIGTELLRLANQNQPYLHIHLMIVCCLHVSNIVIQIVSLSRSVGSRFLER